MFYGNNCEISGKRVSFLSSRDNIAEFLLNGRKYDVKIYHLRYKIGEVSRRDWLRWFFARPRPRNELPLSSPQAGGEGSASVSMQEVDGEAFEGVSIRHGSPHRVLELLVATGGAGATLQLVGWQRRRQQVAKVVVPHGGQLQVLRVGLRTKIGKY